jgi:aspartate/methionine/tyrosine aminotransferase
LIASADRDLPSDIPYIRWAKEHASEGELALTMSAVPPIGWEDIGLDPRELRLAEYTAYGDETLRAGIAAECGWGPERVLLAASASHAHFCFAASLLSPGDRVLHEVPGYLPLLDALSLLRCETVPFRRRPEERYRLPQEEIRRLARDPRAKLLLLTDLHNPSGAALSAADRAFLAALAEERPIEIIADEMYRPYLDPDPGPLCRAHEGIVTIGGLNKVHGLPQIRVGWGIAAEARVRRARRILDATTIHNSCLTDQVARAAWPKRAALVERARRIARSGWEVIGPWLARASLDAVEPAAGLVCFPRVPRALFADGDAFRAAAIAEGVGVTPGRFFGAPEHVRIGWGLEPERLREATRRLDRAIAAAARV